MAYVTPIYGGSAEQIDYRLGLTQHGCSSDTQFAYHVDARERPLRWIGAGLAAFDVAGSPPIRAGDELTLDQYDAARALMRGQHPVTGEQLVTPKLAIPDDAKVSLAPLVAAVRERAQARGVAPAVLFGGRTEAAAFASAERGVNRLGEAARRRVDEAMHLAEAAGLEVTDVWPESELAAAYRNLFTDQPLTDAEGRLLLGEDGVPMVERVARRVPVGIVGYDIGITVPKSVSVLLAFAPEALADSIEGVYADATNRVFGWVEGRTSYVKRGKHGGGHTARHERSSGMSGWVMVHRAARPVGAAEVGDPHWHVHITVSSMARAPDGTWLTIASGGRDLMRHAPAIDHLAQAQIRATLHREYGIEFTRSARTGLWEVAHIPDAAIRHFSKRGGQVTDVLARLGYEPGEVSAKEARVLTRRSRSAKSEVTAASDTTLRSAWRADAAAAGLDPDEWIDRAFARYRAGERVAGAEVNAAMVQRHGIGLDELVARLIDPESGLTAHARRFSALDAVTAVAAALPHGADIGEAERLAELVLSHPAFLALPTTDLVRGGEGATRQLAGAHQMAGGALYTTQDVPAAERTILAVVAASRPEQGRAVVDAAVVDMAVSVTEAAQGFALSGEQRQVLTDLVTDGRAVAAVEGPPGTGKTTLMRAARVAWQAQGYTVAGAATAAVAAQGLAAESGIESRTVAQWRWRIEHGRGLAGIDVVVLDEGNLTSDRDRAVLYAEAMRTGTKVVEVGDPRQLRGVGVGSMFGYLHAALDGPKLTENRRQRSEDERRALAAFRDGRHAEALRGWAERGGLVAVETADEAVAAMVSAWLRLRAGAPDPHTEARGLVMLAATNATVERLNDATQAVRLAEGQLGEGRAFALPTGRDIAFHTGDLVLIRRNDRYAEAVEGEPVLNGYRGVVTAVTDAGVAVAWRQPDDPAGAAPHTTVCSPAYIAGGGLDLGYALTSHKAEGLTVGAEWDRPDGTRNEGSVLVYAPGMDNPALYVSASRDRGQTILFGARDELEGEREQLVYGPPRSQQELTDRVAARLAERAAATASNANDVPVSVDLGHVPREPASQTVRTPATRHDQAERDQTEREQVDLERVRQQYRQLVRAWVHAGDPDSQQAARAALEEFTDRHREHVEAIQRDAQAWLDERARQANAGEVDAGRADRAEPALRRAAELRRLAKRTRITEEWRARPHSRLTDRELARAIHQQQDRAAYAQQGQAAARRQLAELEPLVAAGDGPRVHQVDARVTDLAMRAGLASEYERLARQYQAAGTEASMATRQAEGKDFDATRVTRWEALRHPGLRDRLQAEAGDLRAKAARATQTAEVLGQRMDELVTRAGGDEQLRRASYEARVAAEGHDQDRQRAQDADQLTVDRLRWQVTSLGADAQQAGDTVGELHDEQQLRATMPLDQKIVENRLRSTWQAEQLALETERQQQAELHHTLDHERSYESFIDDHLDHGPGLSL